MLIKSVAKIIKMQKFSDNKPQVKAQNMEIAI